MNTIDWLILIGFILFILWGWREGLIAAAGSIVGTFIGIYAATHWYEGAGNLLSGFIVNENAANVVGFILLLLLSSKLFGLVVWGANKVFNIVAIIPGMKAANRIGGALLGAVEGILILGLAVNFATYLPLTETGREGLEGSWLAGGFDAMTSWLTPFFPDALEKLKDVVL